MNSNKQVNHKILKLITYISFILPVLIIIRFLLGYKVIVYVDIFMTLILHLFLIIQSLSKNESYKLYKLIMITFMLILISGLILPGIEYLGKIKTLYADLLSLVPAVLYISFYIYYFKKGLISLND